MILITIFGFDRCKAGQTSKTLYRFELTEEDEFVDNSVILWSIMILLKATTFIALIMTKNNIFESLFIYIQNKIKRLPNILINDIQLETISRSVSQIQVFEIPIELNEDSNQMNTNFIETINENHMSSIAWIDITLKVKKTFYSEEKLILRGIKGFVRFGTLTALMGPSGAGKTSLLKYLNGQYRDLMTKESKLYLSNSTKIRTCFIAQDQREHIINGLTVNQCLTYASKLKNSGQTVDHSSIVEQLMDELAINEIKNSNIEKCSFGQQKRIVLAMELTSKVKPNLICVDEPTSGVDSYSSLLV